MFVPGLKFQKVLLFLNLFQAINCRKNIRYFQLYFQLLFFVFQLLSSYFQRVSVRFQLPWNNNGIDLEKWANKLIFKLIFYFRNKKTWSVVGCPGIIFKYPPHHALHMPSEFLSLRRQYCHQKVSRKVGGWSPKVSFWLVKGIFEPETRSKDLFKSENSKIRVKIRVKRPKVISKPWSELVVKTKTKLCLLPESLPAV